MFVFYQRAELDNIVYRLYNLIYGEVKAREPGFPLSKVEYEQFETENEDGKYEGSN
jgi:hypothetical protein